MRATAVPGSSVGATSRFADAPDRPVFIGACPRSGTTLLRTMLNSHPELALPHETRILVDTWDRRDAFGDLSREDNRRQLARWLVGRELTRAKRLETDLDTVVERMVAAPPTLGSMLGTCYQLYAEQHGKPRWGDKRPMYARHLGVLLAMFPDAQFVNVVRDPRAAVASIRKIGWYSGEVGPAVDLWLRSVRSARRWRGKLAPDQFAEVKYEDLTAAPQPELERLVAFLRLDISDLEGMLAFHETADIPKSKFHWRVSQPVTSDATRKWEKVLTPEEVALIEQVTKAEMRHYGYEPVGGEVKPGPELWRGYAQRRGQKRKEAWRRAARETKRRFTYRQPVTARLTSGQRGDLVKVG